MRKPHEISGWTYVGFVLSFLANAFLYRSWQEWKDGPWADSPGYGIAGAPYIAAPLPVTFLPCVVCFASLVFVLVGLRASPRTPSAVRLLITGVALIINVLTLISALVGYA